MLSEAYVENHGYRIPEDYLSFSLEACERLLNYYRRNDMHHADAFREQYMPWLEQRIKYLKLQRVIRGE